MIFKELIDDYKEEKFTKRDWIIYGIVIPVALCAITFLGSWFE